MDSQSTAPRPVDVRPLLPLIGLPLLTGGVAFAQYVVRSSLLQNWLSAGANDELAYAAWASAWWAPSAGVLLAMVVAVLGTGWAACATGIVLMLIACAGHLMLPGLTEPGFLWMSLPHAIEKAGWAAFNLGVLVALADGLRAHRGWLLFAGLGAWYGMLNLGGAVIEPLSRVLTPTMAQGIGVGVLLIDGVILAAVGGTWLWLGRRHAEADVRRRQIAWPPLLACAALLLPATLGAFGAFSSSAGALGAIGQGFLAGGSWPYSINPVVCVVAAAGLCLLGLFAHVLRLHVRSWPLGIAALGFALCAVAAILPNLSFTIGPVVASLSLGALGEVLIMVGLPGAWLRGVHWRLLPVLVGAWRLLLDLPIASAVASMYVLSENGPADAQWGIAAILLVVAVGFGILAVVLRRVWTAEAPPSAIRAET